jgi:hypothetical protein
MDSLNPVSDLEKLRHTFRPQPITTLFVGESVPDGGTFFYRQDSLLYRFMKDSFGGAANFLMEFKAKGFFLDDLVLYPVNKMEERERLEHRRKAVPSLARRMVDYRPSAVVIVMRAIEENVVDAMGKAGLSHVPHFVTPFPSFPNNQRRFKADMAKVIPKLPKTAAHV